MPNLKCLICKGEFYAKPFFIKKGFGKYCSNICAAKSRERGEERPCHFCGKISYKQKRDINRSKSGFLFCGKTCQTNWRNKYYSGDKHSNFKFGLYTYRRALKNNSRKKECTLCKNEDLRVLAVHHIDKNRKNNKVENLSWLCHNCHHLIHHHKKEMERFMSKIKDVK